MARNWTRHHVETRDGQAVIRKIVVTPRAGSDAVLNDTPGDNVNMSADQARHMVARARTLREQRPRPASADKGRR